ncbi:hypothetical protein NGRA_2920 [Nosema granulosis]|uniref:Uncharacterized protein n=1 Tax=Nosema granulosis TaxID=83296 RepID=A0A9P6KXQ1_9MICR|nr:hypothetical protein NGRA_2920 [Nosema granulosis]
MNISILKLEIPVILSFYKLVSCSNTIEENMDTTNNYFINEFNSGNNLIETRISSDQNFDFKNDKDKNQRDVIEYSQDQDLSNPSTSKDNHEEENYFQVFETEICIKKMKYNLMVLKKVTNLINNILDIYKIDRLNRIMVKDILCWTYINQLYKLISRTVKSLEVLLPKCPLIYSQRDFYTIEQQFENISALLANHWDKNGLSETKNFYSLAKIFTQEHFDIPYEVLYTILLKEIQRIPEGLVEIKSTVLAVVNSYIGNRETLYSDYRQVCNVRYLLRLILILKSTKYISNNEYISKVNSLIKRCISSILWYTNEVREENTIQMFLNRLKVESYAKKYFGSLQYNDFYFVFSIIKKRESYTCRKEGGLQFTNKSDYFLKCETNTIELFNFIGRILIQNSVIFYN